MRAIRSFFRYAALILVIGGIVVISMTYLTKKEILMALVNNTIVKSSMSVLKTIAIAFGAIMLGLIMFMISMRLSSVIRRSDKEKRQALKEQQKENDELNRKLRQEAEEARAEAEKAKEEANQIRLTLAKEQPEEAPAEEETEVKEEE